jgi:RNA polymerase sigma factor (sigma-70 family)
VVRTAGLLVRQRRRSLERIDFDAEVDQIAELSPEPNSADEVARPMSEYLDRLPEPIRMVLLLRHGFGYSLEEMGELLEITPNAAKKRVSRGHQAIRRMIRKDRVVGLHIGGGKP